MIKQLVGGVWDISRNAMGNLPAGVLRAYGAEPIAAAGGVTTFAIGNSAYDLVDGTLKISRNAAMDATAAAEHGFFATAIGAASQLGFGGIGGLTGGVGGLVTGMMTDIAIESAMVRHAYSPGLTKAGVKIIQSKGFFRNAGTYMAGGVGSAIGGSIGAATGIPGLETAGTLAGANYGVKYAGALGRAGGVGMLAAAGVGAAAAVGYGSYQVLKMGYDHKQRQKMIQTSGSMVSFNTQGAYTMRARAVQAIHKNHLNTRSALGQEASYLHYPSRSYNSRYR